MGNISAHDCQWYYEDFIKNSDLYSTNQYGGKQCNACSNLIEKHDRRPKPCQFSLEDLLENPSLCRQETFTERGTGAQRTSVGLICTCCSALIGKHIRAKATLGTQTTSRPSETSGGIADPSRPSQPSESLP